MALSGRGTNKNRKKSANNCDRSAKSPKHAITLPIQNTTNSNISSESQFDVFASGDHVAKRMDIATAGIIQPAHEMFCLEPIRKDLRLKYIKAAASGRMSSRCVYASSASARRTVDEMGRHHNTIEARTIAEN